MNSRRSGLIRCLNLFALCACTVLTSSAWSLTPQQRAQGLTEEDLEANGKKLGNLTNKLSTELARDAASPFRLSGTLSYGLRQDIALQRSPVLSTHRFLAVGSVTILDRPVSVGFDDDLAHEILTFNVSAAGQFSTMGQEIQGNAFGGPVDAADVDVSLSREIEFDKILGASNALDLTVGSTLPTSEVTQYEGYVAIPYANLAWALGFMGGRYNLTQSVSADYTVNRFSHSPTTREVNSDSSAGYSVATSARLGAGFRFTVGGAARLIHHLDESATSALSNFQILSWTHGFTTITLRHSNGSRAEDHESSLWFVDAYRRIVSLSLNVRF